MALRALRRSAARQIATHAVARVRPAAMALRLRARCHCAVPAGDTAAIRGRPARRGEAHSAIVLPDTILPVASVLLLLLLGLAVDESHGAACPVRTELTNSTGIVTSGPGDYLPLANCTYVILAANPAYYISLEAVRLSFECHWDNFYAIEGPGFNGAPRPGRWLCTLRPCAQTAVHVRARARGGMLVAATATFLAAFTGYTNPIREMVVRGGTAVLFFDSDYSVESTGFLVYYSIDPW